MKHLIILSALFCLSKQENLKLNGKYEVVFSQISFGQNYLIEFQDSIYVKTMPNGERIHGIINYGKHIGSLQDYYFLQGAARNRMLSRTIIEFRRNRIDTIDFSTKTIENLEVGMNHGKLIRIK